MTKQAEAKRIGEALERNANDVHFGRISWEAFGTLNQALWAEVTAPEVRSLVLTHLRNIEWKEQ